MTVRLAIATLVMLLAAGCDHEPAVFLSQYDAGHHVEGAALGPDELVYHRVDAGSPVGQPETVGEPEAVDPAPMEGAERPPEDDWDSLQVAEDLTCPEDQGQSDQLAQAVETIRLLRQQNLQLGELLEITESRLDAALDALYAARVSAWQARNYVVLFACVDAEDVLIRWTYYHVHRCHLYWNVHHVGYVHHGPSPLVLVRLRQVDERVCRLAEDNWRLRTGHAREISLLRQERMEAKRGPEFDRPARGIGSGPVPPRPAHIRAAGDAGPERPVGQVRPPRSVISPKAAADVTRQDRPAAANRIPLARPEPQPRAPTEPRQVVGRHEDQPRQPQVSGQPRQFQETGGAPRPRRNADEFPNTGTPEPKRPVAADGNAQDSRDQPAPAHRDRPNVVRTRQGGPEQPSPPSAGPIPDRPGTSRPFILTQSPETLVSLPGTTVDRPVRPRAALAARPAREAARLAAADTRDGSPSSHDGGKAPRRLPTKQQRSSLEDGQTLADSLASQGDAAGDKGTGRAK